MTSLAIESPARDGSSGRFGHATVGLVLTFASAVCFSWLGVLTKLALDAGAGTGIALAGRFAVAAATLWLVAWFAGSTRPGRREVIAGLALGVGYGVHASLYTAALARLDVGLADLLLFTYPALVTLAAVLLRRDHWSARHGIALAASGVGTGLVLVGGIHSIDPVGAALALAASVTYSAYILASARRLERTDPIALAVLVTTGAAVALAVSGGARDNVSFHIPAPSYGLIAAAGLVGVAGTATFIGGITRLGASRASIVSAVQPALTPVLGFAVFADRLSAPQIAGAAFVIAAVVGLEARRPQPARLSRRVRRVLAREAVAMQVPAGAVVVREGTTAEAFFLIQKGAAEVLREGRAVGGLSAGDFFGEIALVNGGTRTASVVALTNLHVRVLPRREFKRLLRALPAVARVVHDAARLRLLEPSFVNS